MSETFPECHGKNSIIKLKALGTLGNCQRPVISLSVSHPTLCIKQQICEFLGPNWLSRFKDNNERKNLLEKSTPVAQN